MSDPLPSWRDTAAKKSILEFVGAVTDPESADVRAGGRSGRRVRQRRHPLDRESVCPAGVRVGSGGGAREADDTGGVEGGRARRRCSTLLQLTHGSITTDEFDAVVRSWIATARHPRFGRSYAAMVYQPMVELLGFLERNGFDCWIFSGGGADFMRAWAPEVFGIPPHRVIGSSARSRSRSATAGPELAQGHRPRGARRQAAEADLDPPSGRAAPDPRRRQHRRRPADAAMDCGQARTGRCELVVHHTDAEREFAYDRDPVLGGRHRSGPRGRRRRQVDRDRHGRRLGNRLLGNLTRRPVTRHRLVTSGFIPGG